MPTFQTQPKAGSAQLVRKLGTLLITLVNKHRQKSNVEEEQASKPQFFKVLAPPTEEEEASFGTKGDVR